MLKNLRIILFVILPMSGVAQEVQQIPKTNEVYLLFADISPVNMSLKYKHQLKEKTFLKIGLIDLSVSDNTIDGGAGGGYPMHTTIYSAGVEAGIEFRKMITQKFTFFHGPAMIFNYQHNATKVENPALSDYAKRSLSVAYSPGLEYNVGMLFQISEHFFLSAELSPGVLFSLRTFVNGQSPQYNSTGTSLNFNLSSRSGLIAIAYRI